MGWIIETAGVRANARAWLRNREGCDGRWDGAWWENQLGGRLEDRISTVHGIGRRRRLAMVVNTRSIVGRHRVLGKVDGRGEGTSIGERDF